MVMSPSMMLPWIALVRGEGQEFGSAREIADNLEGVVILLMVHAHHKRGNINRRGRDDDPLG